MKFFDITNKEHAKSNSSPNNYRHLYIIRFWTQYQTSGIFFFFYQINVCSPIPKSALTGNRAQRLKLHSKTKQKQHISIPFHANQHLWDLLNALCISNEHQKYLNLSSFPVQLPSFFLFFLNRYLKNNDILGDINLEYSSVADQNYTMHKRALRRYRTLWALNRKAVMYIGTECFIIGGVI